MLPIRISYCIHGYFRDCTTKMFRADEIFAIESNVPSYPCNIPFEEIFAINAKLRRTQIFPSLQYLRYSSPSLVSLRDKTWTWNINERDIVIAAKLENHSARPITWKHVSYLVPGRVSVSCFASRSCDICQLQC